MGGQISLTLMDTSRPLRLDGNNPYRFLPTRVVSTQTLRLLEPLSELCTPGKDAPGGRVRNRREGSGRLSGQCDA